LFHQLHKKNLKLNNTIVACDIGPSVNTFFVFHIFKIENFKILVFNSADKYGSITSTKFQGLFVSISILSPSPSLCASTPSCFALPSIGPFLFCSFDANQSLAKKPRKSYEKSKVFQDTWAT
jgi:hypothetical protein